MAAQKTYQLGIVLVPYHWCQSIDVELNPLAVSVVMRCGSWQVERVGERYMYDNARSGQQSCVSHSNAAESRQTK